MDSLATLAISSKQGLPRVILVEDLLMLADQIQTMVGVHQLRVDPSGMDPLVSFLKDGVLLDDKEEAKKNEERLLVFGCLMSKSCISILSLDHIYFVYTLR